MKSLRAASAGSRIPLAVQLFLPSSASGVLCTLGGMALVTTHVLLVTIHQGTLFPQVVDGQWAIAYTNAIVGPISALFGSRALNIGITALLWGVVGALLYEVISIGLRTLYEWREEEHNVRIGADYNVIRHPLRRNFIARALWHMLIVVLAVALAVAVRPIAEELLRQSEALALANAPTLKTIGSVSKLVLAWAAAGHCGVIMLRLYVLRARLW